MVRVKHRYLLVEILTEQYKNRLHLPVEAGEIMKAIRESVERIHGDYGIACVQVGLAIKMVNPATRTFLVRVRRNAHTYLASSLLFITAIGRVKVVLRTLHLSGTVRSSLKFLRQYDQKKLTELLSVSRHSAELREKAVSLTSACYTRLAKLSSKELANA